MSGNLHKVCVLSKKEVWFLFSSTSVWVPDPDLQSSSDINEGGSLYIIIETVIERLRYHVISRASSDHTIGHGDDGPHLNSEPSSVRHIISTQGETVFLHLLHAA